MANPKVVFLDEPTTGLDPVARRKTWRVIQGLKEGRVVCLTTHSMEEADALGDRIAILSSGRLRALGSCLFLKNKFGSGYNLSMMCVKQREGVEQEVAKLIVTQLPGAEVVKCTSGVVSASVPRRAMQRIATFFAQLEADREAGKSLVDEWGVSNTTLEEVFLRLCVGDKEINADIEGFASAAKQHEEDVEAEKIAALATSQGRLRMPGFHLWSSRSVTLYTRLGSEVELPGTLYTKGGREAVIKEVLCSLTEAEGMDEEPLDEGANAANGNGKNPAGAADTAAPLPVAVAAPAAAAPVSPEEVGKSSDGISEIVVPADGATEVAVPALPPDDAAAEEEEEGEVREVPCALPPPDESNGSIVPPASNQIAAILFKNAGLQWKQKKANCCRCCCVFTMTWTSFLFLSGMGANMVTTPEVMGWQVECEHYLVEDPAFGAFVQGMGNAEKCSKNTFANFMAGEEGHHQCTADFQNHMFYSMYQLGPVPLATNLSMHKASTGTKLERQADGSFKEVAKSTGSSKKGLDNTEQTWRQAAYSAMQSEGCNAIREANTCVKDQTCAFSALSDSSLCDRPVPLVPEDCYTRATNASLWDSIGPVLPSLCQMRSTRMRLTAKQETPGIPGWLQTVMPQLIKDGLDDDNKELHSTSEVLGQVRIWVDGAKGDFSPAWFGASDGKYMQGNDLVSWPCGPTKAVVEYVNHTGGLDEALLEPQMGLLAEAVAIVKFLKEGDQTKESPMGCFLPEPERQAYITRTVTKLPFTATRTAASAASIHRSLFPDFGIELQESDGPDAANLKMSYDAWIWGRDTFVDYSLASACLRTTPLLQFSLSLRTMISKKTSTRFVRMSLWTQPGATLFMPSLQRWAMGCLLRVRARTVARPLKASLARSFPTRGTCSKRSRQ